MKVASTVRGGGKGTPYLHGITCLTLCVDIGTSGAEILKTLATVLARVVVELREES